VEPYDLYNPFVDHTLRLILHIWIVLAYNFNVVILVLIIRESSIGAFQLILLLQFYPCYYLALSFYSCTCWVPTISVLNLAIFPYYSNLLLRRRGWTVILRRGVLGYVLPRLSFLWCYGVFRCFVSLRVVLVFKDIIYVIIILYIHNIWLSVSIFGRMCATIDPRSCIRWVLGFDIKTGYDRNGTRAVSTVRTLA
jgi:hypothetical protein